MTALWPRSRVHAREYRQDPQSFVPSPYAEEMRIAKSEREHPVRERRNRLKGRQSIPRAMQSIVPVDIPQVFRNTPVVTPQEAACLATSQKFSRALSI